MTEETGLALLEAVQLYGQGVIVMLAVLLGVLVFHAIGNLR